VDAKERLAAWDAIFTALAHAARRHIMLTIHFRGGEMSAGEIAKRFSCAWPTTSRHLRVLERAGLIHWEKRGRMRHYRIDRAKLALVDEWLAWFNQN